MKMIENDFHEHIRKMNMDCASVEIDSFQTRRIRNEFVLRIGAMLIENKVDDQISNTQKTSSSNLTYYSHFNEEVFVTFLFQK